MLKSVSVTEEAETPELQSNANVDNSALQSSAEGENVQFSGASGNVEDSSTNAGNRSTAFSDNSADGTEFVLDNEKDIESQFARVTNQKEGQRSAKDSMSAIRLTQVDTIVKNKYLMIPKMVNG